MPLIDIRDTGKFIAPALLNPSLYHGTRFTGAAAYYTPLQLVDTWTRVTGQTVKVLPAAAFAQLSSIQEKIKKEAEVFADFMAKYSYYGPTGKEDLAWTLKQVPERLRTFEDFVRDYEPWF